MNTNHNTATTVGRLYFSVIRNNDFTIVDFIDDIVGVASLDGASNRLRGSENLLDGSLQLPSHRTRSHLSGDIDDRVHRQVTRVLNVLHLDSKRAASDPSHLIMVLILSDYNVDSSSERIERVVSSNTQQ